MLVSYYLPGNRSAHPQEHLVHGSTGHTVDEQTHFDTSRIAGARVDEQCKLYEQIINPSSTRPDLLSDVMVGLFPAGC